MAKSIDLQIYVDGEWTELGKVEIGTDQVQSGYKASGTFDYNFEYLDNHFQLWETKGIYAASVRYPLNFTHFREENWPAFLLDLIPTGAAKQNWLKRLDLDDGPTADFELLSKGAINPPGNIRVKPESDPFKDLNNHPGFEYGEVIGRGVDFIEYAENLGAIVSGTSGAQGVSPKFLLVKDKNGKWHGDGAISEAEMGEHFLVKFPRGKKERDYQILHAEQLYYEVATELGVKVKGPLSWDTDTLFIPRFDREMDNQGKLIRYGLESLVSCLGISEFGVSRNIEEYINVIKQFSTQPSIDIKEFVFRDFLNIVMGNTDNHGRNTALIKTYNSTEISPLFDFAPMVLDDAGIPRVTKWKKETYHIPSFDHVHKTMIQAGIDKKDTLEFLKDSLDRLGEIREKLSNKGMDKEILDFATRKYDEFMKDLSLFVGNQK